MLALAAFGGFQEIQPVEIWINYAFLFIVISSRLESICCLTMHVYPYLLQVNKYFKKNGPFEDLSHDLMLITYVPIVFFEPT